MDNTLLDIVGTFQIKKPVFCSGPLNSSMFYSPKHFVQVADECTNCPNGKHKL